MTPPPPTADHPGAAPQKYRFTPGLSAPDLELAQDLRRDPLAGQLVLETCWMHGDDDQRTVLIAHVDPADAAGRQALYRALCNHQRLGPPARKARPEPRYGQSQDTAWKIDELAWRSLEDAAAEGQDGAKKLLKDARVLVQDQRSESIELVWALMALMTQADNPDDLSLDELGEQSALYALDESAASGGDYLPASLWGAHLHVRGEHGERRDAFLTGEYGRVGGKWGQLIGDLPAPGGR